MELTVGGALEGHKEGSLVGPTFHCILMEQFKRTRAGDRFFYELGPEHSSLTPAQLKEIRKASMARLFCDHSDGVISIQPKVFKLPTNEAVLSNGDRYTNKKSHFSGIVNPLIPCLKIPELDLSHWFSTSTV